MAQLTFFTIGVFGSTADSFFKKLTDNKIDTFCDIRQRRGVRGSEYTFVNSKRLQEKLRDIGINYIHTIELAAPDIIRKIQYEADKKENIKQRKRETLSGDLIKAYKEQVLNKFDFNEFIKELKSAGSQRVALFCVEKNPSACHRSIVSEHLKNKFGFAVKHL